MFDARIKFAVKYQLVKHVKFNQMSNKSYINQLWCCQGCKKDGHGFSVDSQLHILVCKSYEHLRVDRDMDCDKDMVGFFRDVINLREKSII